MTPLLKKKVREITLNQKRVKDLMEALLRVIKLPQNLVEKMMNQKFVLPILWKKRFVILLEMILMTILMLKFLN